MLMFWACSTTSAFKRQTITNRSRRMILKHWNRSRTFAGLSSWITSGESEEFICQKIYILKTFLSSFLNIELVELQRKPWITAVLRMCLVRFGHLTRLTFLHYVGAQKWSSSIKWEFRLVSVSVSIAKWNLYLLFCAFFLLSSRWDSKNNRVFTKWARFITIAFEEQNTSNKSHLKILLWKTSRIFVALFSQHILRTTQKRSVFSKNNYYWFS